MVPIEERIAFWNEKKTGKYEEIIADHGSPSWKLKCIVAEGGCQGYIPPSFRKALQLFGFTSKELKALVDECSLVKIKLLHLAQPFSLNFHSISDGSSGH